MSPDGLLVRGLAPPPPGARAVVPPADPGQAPVAVLGGSGRIGQLLVARLRAARMPVVVLGRDPARAAGLDAPWRPADDLSALGSCRALACCAPPCLVPALARQAAARGMRLVVLGSTRRYTRFPDASSEAVRAAEAAVAALGANGLILHATMIYGAGAENNVQRIAALLRRTALPGRTALVPLPGGGRSLIQPVHAADVAEAMARALTTHADLSGALALPGPRALPWAGFVRAIAEATGFRARIVPVPMAMARTAAIAMRLLPALPPVGADEIRRLAEDKDFPVGPAAEALGFIPRPLAEGLREVFG